MPLVHHSTIQAGSRQIVADSETSVPDQKSKKRGLHAARWFFYFFSLLVFVLVVFYFPEIRRELAMLQHVNKAWLSAALVFQLCSYLFTALVYRVLLKAENVSKLPSPMEMYRTSIILLFFNLTIPSAGVSSNSFLYSYLRKKNLPAPQIISLILTELLTYYAGVLFVTVCLLVFALIAGLPGVVSIILAAGLLVYLAFSTVVVWAGRKNSMAFIWQKLTRIKLLHRIIDQAGKQFAPAGRSGDGFNMLAVIRQHPPAIVKSFLLQLALFAADVFTIVALFYGIGVHVSIVVISFGVIGSRIVTVLPFSPGGLILFESSMSFFFVTLGIPLATAVIVTLLFRFLSFWLPIPAGFLLYRQWLRHNRTI